MPGRRPDLTSANARRAPGTRHVAPGQVGAGVVVIAGLLAAIVVATRDGQAYWLCVPGCLLAAAWCESARTTTLATALIVAGAGAPALALAADRPATWAAVLVPAASVAVLHAVRTRLISERDGLRDFALTDPLTRVANRRALFARAEHEAVRHRRAQRPFAVVMLDLDGFKTLNDRFGHGAGDDLLRDVAGSLDRAMRAQDTVARIGGDEFCVLAPETDAEGAERLAARVSAAVRAVTAGTASVRASVGAAVYPDDATDPARLIEVADARLLQAKRELYRHRPAPARRAA